MTRFGFLKRSAVLLSLGEKIEEKHLETRFWSGHSSFCHEEEEAVGGPATKLRPLEFLHFLRQFFEQVSSEGGGRLSSCGFFLKTRRRIHGILEDNSQRALHKRGFKSGLLNQHDLPMITAIKGVRGCRRGEFRKLLDWISYPARFFVRNYLPSFYFCLL